ncbi:protein ECT2-like [Gigantopelta aegis]|uniref:protein ECT2-like n=1 Tax=Gigantopelta aegis TaxID=1735272 RepID=UPI001B88782F|nr:protein ECT2-like [Gigantopelta aegis]XP_041358745.1 protein ECT2-like [Gigantopelta aegis]
MAEDCILEVVKEDDDKELKIVLVGKETQDNEDLTRALTTLEADIVNSETGLEHVQDASEFETMFILTSFEGDVYHKLHRAEARILGPAAVISSIRNNETLPFTSRPLFCTAMKGLILCFTGFKVRDQLCHLVDLVHHMGGSVRKDINSKVTHLIANASGSQKYKFAVSMGTPIMSEDWIHRIWTERDDLDIKADSEKMMSYRLRPFFECSISFLGFSAEEQKHMEELTIENGGRYEALDSEESTHLVVDDHNVKELPSDLSLPQYVVRAEWFWGGIQMEACADEAIYTFHKPVLPSKCMSNSSLPGYKLGKRKRLKQLVDEGEVEFLSSKRRSSELGISMSPNSFLDASHTPDKSDYITESKLENNENHMIANNAKPSARQLVVKELLQTEINYVGILNTILNTFKAQIEKPDQYNGPLLPPPAVKIIFGNIPPIYDAHCKMRAKLQDVIENWREDISIGDVILQHADALTTAYPPFVNFFENTKKTILESDKTNPRFHAFLKVCLTRPECGRQTLEELLIRPVQRLPSVVLLLGDIKKHTDSKNPDHQKLDEAISKLKGIMTYINEDKRRTDNQVAMFDIMKEIDNCPATLISSHRSFVDRIDVLELSDHLSGRGNPLSLFIFTDSIEICKRRVKVLHSTRSPAAYKTPQKAYKHIEMMSLTTIKRVLNVIESDDCRGVFAFITRNNMELKEKLYSFMLDMEDVSKTDKLRDLCKHLANTLCRTDYETLLATVKGDELNINTKDLSNKLSKAVKFGKRVSRAFSFNKTPSRLKRAISSVTHKGFSPFVRENSVTPGDLKGRRLASTFDLTDSSPTLSHFDDSDSISLGAFSLQEEISPRSFQTPSKKLTKYTTLGPSSAKKYL